MTAEQYRELDRDALEERRDLVANLLEKPEEDGPDMEQLRSETELIRSEFERRDTVKQLRSMRLEEVKGGKGTVVEKRDNRQNVKVVEPDDPFATDAYNRAFKDRIQRGIPIPGEYAQYRADQFTTVATDAGDVVPTNLMNRIIQEEDEYGELLNRVSKSSYPGGIAIPTADINPEAKWITEDATSDDQKIAPDDPIVFGYYGLEVKLAQSILSQAITLSAFQDQFVRSASRAMIKAKEKGILSGTGSSQMLGVLNDSRVKSEQKLSMGSKDVSTWAGWSKFNASIKLAYRRGILIMNKGTWDTYVDGMVDSAGQPVARVNYGIQGQAPYRFRGTDVLLVDDYLLPDYDTASSDAAFAVFMDPADYLINSPLPLRTNRWTNYDENKVKLQMVEFLDGKLVTPFGVRILTKASA